MKKLKIAILIALLLILKISCAWAQAPAIEVKKGLWRLFVIYDTTGMHIPLNDTTWMLSPDTVKFPYPVYLHDTVRIHDTTYAQFTVHDTIRIRDTINNCSPSKVFLSIITTTAPPTVIGNDGKAIELGVKFRASINAFIYGVRYYKIAGMTGAHIGELYSSAGVRLASAPFVNETASGWQSVQFASPVAIQAGISYVAAYFSPSGQYPMGGANGFNVAIQNGYLTGLASGTDGVNGLYIYSTVPAMPGLSYQKSNYFSDVIASDK